ncbi:MAG: hypothetical protein RLY86_1252 [Pseudomonadota bacterium]|jgi:hypothetical protein
MMGGWLETLALAGLVLALLPLGLGCLNLLLFRAPPGQPPAGTAVSILIPARNEAAGIGDAVRAALASRGVAVEVVVLDDQSTDATAFIVRDLAGADRRVRLETAPPLPDGWSGKQHACHILAQRARHPILLFQDADVRLSPDAAARMSAALLARPGLHLLSAFPREETGSLGEALIVPQIHVLLLGYLPLLFTRIFRGPAFAAGCGQVMLARADAYQAAGGHGAIRTSLHDGMTLPRAFRRAGFGTDIVDGTPLARCRMYRGLRETWDGFAKNATEGMATPVGLPVWTLLLGGGHVLPWLLLPIGLLTGQDGVAGATATAIAATLLYRVLLALRFRQDWRLVPLHPLGVVLILAIQWTALIRHQRGRPATWRGRSYLRA